MKKISILGSTGSIGRSTLEVIGLHRDRFEVVGLVAGSNVGLLGEQIAAFRPKKVAVRSPDDAKKLKDLLTSEHPAILVGESGAVEVATDTGADLVVSAIVGAAGLVPTLESLRAGIDVALANKESLVIAGKIITDAAGSSGANLIPIDSEHSAIFQVLAGNGRKGVRRIILTASGGPFRETPRENFSKITVEEALNHPNWSMGNKISVDSATMMNKGLELIEATWLFGFPPDMIDIHIHPQSIVHSMVEYVDGSIIAQMGVPDMRCAIAYGLSFPERMESGVGPVDLFNVRELGFYPPDFEKFSTLALSYEAARLGGSYPVVLNAANEVAVAAFLERKIRFSDIFRLVESTFHKHSLATINSVDDVFGVDRWARVKTEENI